MITLFYCNHSLNKFSERIYNGKGRAETERGEESEASEGSGLRLGQTR